MKTRSPAFQDPDPSHGHFQYLEDLATAYWHSEALFAALEIGLIDQIEKKALDTEAMAGELGARPQPLERLLGVLSAMTIVNRIEGKWYNCQVSGKYLLKDGDAYIGDFLIYRRYLQPQWNNLVSSLGVARPTEGRLSKSDDYRLRNLHYVQAMDSLARRKAREISALLTDISLVSPVLDVGGGAGALARQLTHDRPHLKAFLMDLPEVLDAARELYPEPDAWVDVEPVAGDFRMDDPFAVDRRFGLIILSNFLHAYNAEDAKKLLGRAVSMMKPNGFVLIHDYFPDLSGQRGLPGAFHDLNMMLNTYDGACHNSNKIRDWLEEEGLHPVRLASLESDSAIILAAHEPVESTGGADDYHWVRKAIQTGFHSAVPIDPSTVETAGWVQAKCRFGCGGFGRNLQCPPHTTSELETEALLSRYSRAVLVEGEPPGKMFHEKLLELEKAAFMAGFYKALVFGAGPCPVCGRCAVDKGCRFPDKARPSMEASGIDVYETARRAGIRLKPVTDRGQYVKYLGLLLLE